MLKCVFIFCFSVAVSAASSPQEVFQNWQKCQTQTSLTPFCQTTRAEALVLHQIIDELQHNPQELGIRIMNMQTELSASNDASDPDKRAYLEKVLNTVGWLESPQ